MKQLLYIFCLLSLVACNADKAKTTAAKTATDLQTPPVAAEGLNPVHGAPGHRCDIDVGAPLSSPVAQPNATMQQAAPQMPVAPSATPTASENGKKLNPAHGMPGHDCALPVGAPLT